MAASARGAKHAIRTGATAVAIAVCLSVGAGPARAAGLGDRIIVAHQSRSGTVYWSFTPDGRHRRQVLRTSGSEVLVRSGDGRQVLALETEHSYGLHLARADGRDRHVLAPVFDPTPSAMGSDGIALSPTGATLAGIVRHTTYQPPVQVCPCASPDPRYELVTFDATGANRRVILPMTRETPLSNLQWTPAGRDLAFVRAPFVDCGAQNGEHPDCTYTVELISADGSAPPRVVARVGRPFGAEVSYALSPDGRRIAYQSTGGTRLVVAAIDGSHRRALSRGAAAEFNWSPDGRKILYAAGRAAGPDFYTFDRWRIVTVSSGRIVRFAKQALVEAWSPDGRRLLGIDGRRRGLLLYRPDGRVERGINGTKQDVLGGAIWEGGSRLR